MDESFRRAIRKMTGTSIVRFGSRPNRASMIANLSQSMNATWSIALYEHLDANDSNPSATMAGPETSLLALLHGNYWGLSFPIC